MSMNVIPIHVGTEERVKILSMDTNVSVLMVIQEHSARLVSAIHVPPTDTFHKQINMFNKSSHDIINDVHASKISPLFLETTLTK